jgi:hypothetical protein
MRPRLSVFLSVLILCVAFATPLRAQNDSATSPPQSGQTAGSSQSQSTAPAPSTSKKVWTNDDVADLREGSEVSTFNSPSTRNNRTATKPGSKGRDAKWYQDQIAKLQKQIPPLDNQIAALQSAIDGKPTGDGKTSARPYGVKLNDWSVELADLQKKRDGLTGQINALEDEARRKGIPENQLP